MFFCAVTMLFAFGNFSIMKVLTRYIGGLTKKNTAFISGVPKK